MATQYAVTQTAWGSTVVANAANTLIAAGTDLPTRTPTLEPTETPTQSPTPSVTPSPTATPFTGWKQFTEDGVFVRDMPLGWNPVCGGVLGCPGKLYIQYVNGASVSGKSGQSGTPGYWPWLLFGTIGGLILAILLYVAFWGISAPQRAIAKVTVQIGQAYAAMLMKQGQAQQTLPAPGTSDGIPVETLAKWLVKYMQAHQVPSEFRPEIGNQLRQYTKGQLIPISVILAMLQGFDRRHNTDVSPGFGRFVAEEVHSGDRNQRYPRMRG